MLRDPSLNPSVSQMSPMAPLGAVHLDFKGLPPTFDRLLGWLDGFAALGFRALLVEWEDLFPWQCEPKMRSTAALSPDEVKRFHARAAELGLEVIPLVQCLGHLESLLQIDRYAPLREVGWRTDCLNPLAPGALAQVEAMITEVADATPDARYFHLGGDEAWFFGKHAQTAAFIAEHGAPALYLQHIEPLLELLERRGMRPILWHDMMIDWPEPLLRRLGARADLMVWGYRGTPAEGLHHHRREVLDRLSAAGLSLWGGGAFKGADGPYRDVPDREARRVNTAGWVQAMRTYGLRGLVFTGWSRYGTPRVQVEPLDATWDVLAMAGAMLQRTVTEEDLASTPWSHWEAMEARADAVAPHPWRPLRDRLQVLQKTRDDAWLRVRQISEHLAGIELDDSRGDGGMARFLWDHLVPCVDRVEELTAEVTEQLRDGVAEPWAGYYAGTWLRALRQATEELHRRITVLGLPQPQSAAETTTGHGPVAATSGAGAQVV